MSTRDVARQDAALEHIRAIGLTYSLHDNPHDRAQAYPNGSAERRILEQQK
ncbi:hypothetical protein [Rhodococcus sp. 1168]|uniref:hypothetical protein n=1 Tax=Rhodococcus sp. 1168 TaxID=2018041 RepID=UPI001593B4B5|nr:hypothetical protein [Rhodococcus sp. 1168]